MTKDKVEMSDVRLKKVCPLPIDTSYDLEFKKVPVEDLYLLIYSI